MSISRIEEVVAQALRAELDLADGIQGPTKMPDVTNLVPPDVDRIGSLSDAALHMGSLNALVSVLSASHAWRDGQMRISEYLEQLRQRCHQLVQDDQKELRAELQRIEIELHSAKQARLKRDALRKRPADAPESPPEGSDSGRKVRRRRNPS